MKSSELEKIIEIKDKLQLLLPYIKNDNIRNVVKWAKTDIEEIHVIQRELEKKDLLEEAYKHKKANEIRIYKSDSIEKDILNIYRNIEKELNYWREISIEIRMRGRV